VRIPGWAPGQPAPSDLYHYVDATSTPATITVNGQPVALTLDKGYAHIQRTWQPDDIVEVTLPMPVRRVVSHPNVKDTAGKVAVERGPLVYCAEGVDNGGHVLDKGLSDAATISTEFKPDLLNGVTVLQVQQPAGNLSLVPYYAWAHRGVGEMTVWFRRNRP